MELNYRQAYDDYCDFSPLILNETFFHIFGLDSTVEGDVCLNWIVSSNSVYVWYLPLTILMHFSTQNFLQVQSNE